jgi:type I restriction enzyme, S subunit
MGVEKLVGAVPGGWEYTTLGEACHRGGGGIQTGPFGSQLHASDYVPMGVPSIMPQNIGDNRVVEDGIARITPEDARRLDRYLVRPGDIVYSRRGDVERRALITAREDGWLCGTGCLRVRPGSEGVDPRYASYYLGDPRVREWIVRHAHGATMPNLNTSILSAVPFVIPPSDEQRSIAHILGTLDDKIELNRRMNETMEAMARALFKSWFVDFDPIRAKAEGRDPGLPKHLANLFPDSFEDSELGEIPTGWETGTIGSVAKVIDCLHSKKPERRESGYPLLQLSNIRDDGLIDMRDSYFIEEPDYRRWISRIEASAGDCVVTNVGRVGAVAQVPVGLRAALGRNMTGIRCRETFPHPTFLIECLRSQAMKEEMDRKTDSGTILNALNVRSIPTLRFAQPPQEVLHIFEREVRPLRAMMERRLAESETLSAIRDAVLPKLISGEVRVDDPDGFLERELAS